MRRIICVLVVAASYGACASAVSAKTVWLCRPGHRPDPCAPGLSTTVYSTKFHKVGVEHPKRLARPPIDCFYVYPTVSDQKTGNANRHIDPEERSIALYQAARYSQYCRVYAPMYRQVTLAALGNAATTPPNSLVPFQDVDAAFKTYLRKYNHGRGFVLIGHSQGSFVLRTLIADDVDRTPAVRKRLLSAILLGGNVLVKRGKGIGGDFRHIPACRSARQLHCVIAFSTFDQVPPPDSRFGRAAPAGIHTSDQVLCTNPAALGGGTGILNPIAPSVPFASGTILSEANAILSFPFPHPPTVWWTAPRSYSARCQTLDGATVLEIKSLRGAPKPNPSPDPTWGLHLLDANIALGNLVAVVRTEERAFAR
jgi:hypothetical protein